jgi:hypothetical protein
MTKWPFRVPLHRKAGAQWPRPRPHPPHYLWPRVSLHNPPPQHMWLRPPLHGHAPQHLWLHPPPPPIDIKVR